MEELLFLSFLGSLFIAIVFSEERIKNQENNSLENLMRFGYAASCRIQANKAMGSATIVYSKNGSTYALTNYHVVESNIEFKKVWDSLLKRELKKEFLSAVEVLYPRLNEENNVVGYSTVLADVVLHDQPKDIALLKFRDKIAYSAVKWYPREKAGSVPFLARISCIGAALGLHPVVTFGNLNGKQHEIDNYEYWLSSAQSIFGNSGGGVFIEENNQWYFLGIPSRISVIPLGFGANAVTHLGFFIPIKRIYNWLEENYYQFLWDPRFTEEQCNKLREEARKREPRMSSLIEGGEEGGGK